MKYYKFGSNRYKKKIIVFISILCLNSCGFSPVYQRDSNSTVSPLQSIKVKPLDSIEGVYYYNSIKNILPPKKDIKYELGTKLFYSKDYSIIYKNSDVLREVFTIKVEYELRDINSKKIITSGKFSRLSSYSVNFSPYNNQQNQEEVKKRLAIISAEEVRNRIILFLRRNI